MTERLYRSRRDRMLAGVAGGLAEMWDVDPSLVRIAWALLAILTGGVAILVYIVMAIVIPEEEDGAPAWSHWPTPPPPPPAPGATPPDAGAAAAAAASAADPVASAPPAAAGAAAGPAAWTSPYGTRDGARAARREARDARRASRGERNLQGSAIFGVILVGIGIYFLAREWLPEIDFDWFWPLVLVGIGVVLLVSALSRKPDEPGGTS